MRVFDVACVVMLVMVSFSAMIPNMFVFEPVSGSITGVQLPGSGDWEITSPTVVTDETISFHGNIIVTNSLTLINTTLLIDCDYDGQYGIDVLSGGHLIIEDYDGHASNITSANQYAYTFAIRNGAEAELTNSEIHMCGYDTGNPIDCNSGLYIESEDVIIEGCSITKNHVGVVFNSTQKSNTIVGSISTDDTTYVSVISNNTYGVYAMGETEVQFDNAIVTNNDEYDIYADTGSNIQMNNCHPVAANKIGGGGTVIQGGSQGGWCYNQNDYFEIDYNEYAKTLKYEGWLCWQNGNDAYYYANSYCVVRRNYNYNLLENPGLSLMGVVQSGNPEYGISGWQYSISFPKAPSDQTTLLQKQSGNRMLSIPSNYPILYCTITMNIFWFNSYYVQMQSIDMYIILDLPSTSGTDVKTQLTGQARSEYLYDDSSASYIPANIDFAGPFWWGDGSSPNLSYYGGGSNTSGINYNKKIIYQLACAAAYNCQLGFDAADKIKIFVNYLIYGNWENINNTAYNHSVNESLENVTTKMASNPSNNIVHDIPLSNPDTSDHDALGLHGKCASEHGIDPPNNWDYQCQDFAAISTALDRAIGLAARQVTGWKYNETGISMTLNYHLWTEVWIPNGQASNGSRDDQWCVFDACGCCATSYIIHDNDTLVYAGNTRTGYYNGLNNYFGHPWKIYCYFKTTDSQTVQYELTTYYK